VGRSARRIEGKNDGHCFVGSAAVDINRHRGIPRCTSIRRPKGEAFADRHLIAAVHLAGAVLDPLEEITIDPASIGFILTTKLLL
jgi:hypothetical protein